MKQTELLLGMEIADDARKAKKFERRLKKTLREVAIVERAIKAIHKNGFSDCQLLVLLVLARKGEPMQIGQIASEIKRHRQVVGRAVQNFTRNEVIVHRPKRSVSIVKLQTPGLELLREILNQKGN